MGLNITFSSVKKTDIASFGKLNFILTYFGINESDNCKGIVISYERFRGFVNDLISELMQHKYPCTDEPVNPKFRFKNVSFGGSTTYDETYWENLRSVYDWAEFAIKTFNWMNCEMVLNAKW